MTVPEAATFLVSTAMKILCKNRWLKCGEMFFAYLSVIANKAHFELLHRDAQSLAEVHKGFLRPIQSLRLSVVLRVSLCNS
jgi:hypothetical protein